MLSVADRRVSRDPRSLPASSRWLTAADIEETPWFPGVESPGISALTIPRTVKGTASSGRYALEVEWEGSEPPWLQGTLEVLAELPGLPENWNSYGARPVALAAITAAVDLLLRVMPDTAPPPQVVPVASGGVQLEWHAGGIDLEITVRPTGEAIVLFEDLRTEEEWEGRLPDRRIDLARALAGLASPP